MLEYMNVLYADIVLVLGHVYEIAHMSMYSLLTLDTALVHTYPYSHWSLTSAPWAPPASLHELPLHRGRLSGSTHPHYPDA